MLAAIADRIRSESYELPLSRDNVRHWGLKEAVRELIQNALDSESPFEYAFAQGQLFITSRFARLEARTLVLGSTSKSDRDDAIGSFGEGYKTLSRRCRTAEVGRAEAQEGGVRTQSSVSYTRPLIGPARSTPRFLSSHFSPG